MAKQSAGLLVYRVREGIPEVFLVHPGGPFWVKKDAAAWSIPKGEFEDGEDPLATARREFTEETGLRVPDGELTQLTPVTQPSRKKVHAWFLAGDVDASAVRSNTFELEWPPKSGKTKEFPEVDRACWCSLSEAKTKLHKGQVPLVEQLEDLLSLERSQPRR